VQRFVEKLVTIARRGWDFNTIRRLKRELPYSDSAVKKLVKERAAAYVGRPGGYTRVYRLGRRKSDTSPIAVLKWV
jgi:ribosomal protein L17